MIEENYCSFETAKLLKEKGFYGECLSMYLTPKPRSGMGNPNEAKIAPHGRDSHYYEGYKYQCEAPTLQMAMKWLREKHKLYCDIRVGDGDFVIDIISLKDGEFGCEVAEPESCVYPTYEEAAEAAIKYVLENLI